MNEVRSCAWAQIRGPRLISPGGSVRNAGKNERPVRGDNRTGQAIWALGVDGRSRRIQPRWGGITAPTLIGRGRGVARSNRPADFFSFLAGVSRTENYCAAGRLASPAADLSETM